MKNKWFAISVMPTTPDCTEVMIYDDIGAYGVTAADFVTAFNQITTPKITVRLNTLGGSVFDGLAIYNAIDQSKADVTVRVDGIAASIGSIIALAGDRCIMAANSFMMIHNAWSYCQGNAAALRKEADILDKLDAQMASIYAGKTGKGADAMAALTAAETWMSADDALKLGFIDTIDAEEAKPAEIQETAARASTRFASLPATLRNAASAFIRATMDAKEHEAASHQELRKALHKIEMDERAALA